MTTSDGPVAEPRRGRTRVTARALNRVVSAVAAEALGVHVRHVGVELHDDHGALGVGVSTRFPTVAGRRTDNRDLLEYPGGSLLDRSGRAQQVIRERVAVLIGSSVGHVTVRFTGATTQRRGRVR